MKNTKILVGVFCFILGVATITAWRKHNYVSIPKNNTIRTLASQQQKLSESSGQQLIIDTFTEKILAMDSKAKVDETAAYIQDTAKKYPDFVGVQMFAAVASIAPLVKGLGWRLRGIVEDTDVTHSVVLTNLRFFYMSRYAYGKHILALFHYLFDPPNDEKQFYKISELQDELLKITPTLEKYLDLAKQSMSLPIENHQFELDRRIYFGLDDDKGFFDDQEAKKTYIKPYTSTVISVLARTIGFIKYLSVYNFDATTAVMRDVLRKSAINKIRDPLRLKKVWSRIRGRETKTVPNVISREQIFKLVRKYKKWGTSRFKSDKAQKLLDEAYEMFVLSSEHDLKGYVCSIEYPRLMLNGDAISNKYSCYWGYMEAENFMEEENFVVGGSKFLIDPNLLLINHRQDFHELRDRYRIYHPTSDDGIVEITSDATGVPVRINAKGPFKLQESLQNYFPTKFSNGLEYDDIRIEGNVAGTHIKKTGQWIWNWDYGRPVAWDSDYVTFSGLFPDATNENIYDIMYSVRLTRSLRPFSNFFTTVP